MARRWAIRQFQLLSFVQKVLFLALVFVMFGALGYWARVGYYAMTVEAPRVGGVYTEAVIGAPVYYNPLLVRAGDDAEAAVVQLVYSGLFRADGRGAVVPDLAERYEMSDDAKTFTVFLRTDAVWHDGEQVTADDVIYTINTIKDKRFAIAPSLAQAWSGVNVERVDDRTVRFILDKPFAAFVSAQLRIGILPAHIWKDVDPSAFLRAQANVQPIGSGPYRFMEAQVDAKGQVQAVILERFTAYYARKPFIERIKILFVPDAVAARDAYVTHRADAFSVVPRDLATARALSPAPRIHTIAVPSIYGIFFNPLKSAALAYQDVREALTRATDREAIVRDVLHGAAQVITTPFTAGMAWYTGEDAAARFDVAAANALLDRKGWKRGDDGIRAREGTVLRFTLLVPEWGDLLATAQVIAQQWRAVGADVQIRAADAEAFRSALAQRDYGAVLFGQTYFAFDADPFAFWHSSQKDAPGLNFAQLTNKDIDKILADAQKERDAGKREELAARFAEQIADIVPATFLYSPYYLLAQRETVRGVSLERVTRPAERFATIADWYVETKRVWRARD